MMFNVRLAGDHLYEKSLFSWLSLLMSLMVSYFVLFFLCPATKMGVLCSTLRTFECLSVRLSVRPSAVEHSCPVHNFDTVRDNFTKLGTNINHDQTTCRD